MKEMEYKSGEMVLKKASKRQKPNQKKKKRTY